MGTPHFMDEAHMWGASALVLDRTGTSLLRDGDLCCLDGVVPVTRVTVELCPLPASRQLSSGSKRRL